MVPILYLTVLLFKHGERKVMSFFFLILQTLYRKKYQRGYMAQKSISFWNFIGCFLQVILTEQYQGFISIKAPKITR